MDTLILQWVVYQSRRESEPYDHIPYPAYVMLQMRGLFTIIFLCFSLLITLRIPQKSPCLRNGTISILGIHITLLLDIFSSCYRDICSVTQRHLDINASIQLTFATLFTISSLIMSFLSIWQLIIPNYNQCPSDIIVTASIYVIYHLIVFIVGCVFLLYSKLRDCRSIVKVTLERPIDMICPICLDEYKHGDIVSELACGHQFHPQCVNKWLKERRICPMCRRSSY